MTPINFAIQEIFATIPHEVLKLAFLPKSKYRHVNDRYNSTTIEQAIRNKVIDQRLRAYVDSRGAQEINIPLYGLPIQYDIQGSWSCHIPKERIGGRTITHAISVHRTLTHVMDSSVPMALAAPTMGVQMNSGCTPPQDLRSARELYDANRPMDLNFSPNVYLINENTIFCEDRMPINNLALKCLVAADLEFTSISPSYYVLFSEMCSLLVQSYIYNNLVIRLDKAAIEGGVDIGAIREVVDKYSDAEERFKDAWEEKYRKMLFFSDKGRSNRYVSLLLSKGG